MEQQETHSTPSLPGLRNLLVDDLQAEVDAAAKFGLFEPTEVELLATIPLTVLISPKSGEHRTVSNALNFIAKKFFPELSKGNPFLFRGVKLSRLAQIASTSCDVIPSTAPIYATPYPAKALEYGEVVMAFDADKLDKTFRRVSKSENPETLRRLRLEYPTMLEVDGDWLWFSRLPPDEGRTGTIYESHYTFFIPGDPREALLTLFLVGSDRNALRTEFLRTLSSSSSERRG